MSNGAANGTSRRAFLGRAAGAAVAVAGAGVGAGAFAQSAAAATGKRSYTSGKFSFDLDGYKVGNFKSMDGGDLANTVVFDKLSPDRIQRKHLGPVAPTDCTIGVGSGMAKGMYDWMKAAFDHGFDPSARRSASVSALGLYNTEVARRRFASAVITQVTIPALDVTSTEVATVDVTFSSSKVSDATPSGSPVLGRPHKPWMCSNFKLEIDGLDTSRVASIDSFTWTCALADDGSLALDMGNIRVVAGASSASSWQKWLANQQSGAVDERNGTLTILGASQGGVLKLSLYNLGVFQVKPAHPIGGVSNGFFVAQMYCEGGGWDVIPLKKI